VWELVWEYEAREPADWDEGARPHLEISLELHKGKWSEDDFRELLDTLGHAGYGWLRPEGVRKNLEKLTERYPKEGEEWLKRRYGLD